MSDSEDEREVLMNQQLHERLTKVSPELLSEFLYKRGVPVVRCLMCGSADIGIPQRQELTVGPDGSADKVYVDYTGVVANGQKFSLLHCQYRLICRNCGFVSNLAAFPVLKWIELEKEGENE